MSVTLKHGETCPQCQGQYLSVRQILSPSRPGERLSAASAAGEDSIWITAPDFLTCGGRPESHPSPKMRPAGCGPRMGRRGAQAEGMKRSARHAEERFHTSRPPAEDRGENETAGLSESSSPIPFTPLVFDCSRLPRACLFKR